MAKLCREIFIALTIGLIFGCDCVSISDSAYRDIVVEIKDTIPIEECYKTLINLEKSITSASEYLFSALDGRAYIGNVIIIYPTSWPTDCVPFNQTTISTSGEKSDITISETHPIYNDQVWTKQYAGCGEQGEQIFLSHKSLERDTVGKEFVREWAKYRYGVFDETGYSRDTVYPKCYTNERRHVTGCSDSPLIDNGYCDDSSTDDVSETVDPTARSSILFSVESPGVAMFCDEGSHNRYAPTKHNYMCDRQSALDVIIKHTDFDQANMIKIEPSIIVNTTPRFEYKKRNLTRYVLVIDETQDMNVRESWSFLRNAIRKWIVYDLPNRTEVGMIMVNESGSHTILSLNTPKTRDTIASFFPFTPIDTRQQACIGCSIKDAIEMLNERNIKNGPSSSVIIVIAPGMDYNTDYRNLSKIAKESNIRISTINYPAVVRRQPLDPLASLSNGLSFSVYEAKYNSDKSYLSTYFELINVFYHITVEFYEGNKLDLPIEIHRKELVDNIEESNSLSKRTSRVITGSFFLDSSVSTPSGFYIYTHSVDQPLIQDFKLISPSEIEYSERSEQRLILKQLSINAAINETGSWIYEIKRFIGNPQSHYVQVLATPKNIRSSAILARSWIKRKSAGPIIIYAEIKKGELPVLSAHVEVTVTRPDLECNETNKCKEKFLLLDSGSGDPDVMKGDGIYSRYFSAEASGAGTYRFEIVITDNGNTAYTLASRDMYYSKTDQTKCCGSFIPSPSKEPLPPCQRFLPAHTIFFTKEELSSKDVKMNFGKIGDLRSETNGTKIQLKWTSPDMGGSEAGRYQVKYSTRLSDIIDNYETAAVLWNHNSPNVHAIGDDTTINLNFTNESHLYGKNVYFAIRAYSRLTVDALLGPVSNYVHVFVPHPYIPTTPNYPPYYNSDDDSSNFDPYQNEINGNTNYEIMPKVGKQFNNVEYIIVSSLVILIILFALIIICIFLMKRRGNRNGDNIDDKKNIKKNTDSKNMINVIIEPQAQTIPQSQHDTLQIQQQMNQQQLQHQQQQQQQQQQMQQQTQPTYAYDQSIIDEIPDPHTIGLPIYTENYDYPVTKRYSLVNQQEQQLIEELKNQQNNYNGLSIISTSNTLIRTGRTLSPYESWTASQLLHEHEKRISPMDEMMQQQDHVSLINGQNCDRISITTTTNTNAPPVPPLPYVSNVVYPTNPSSYQRQRDLSGLPFNPSLQGSICSVNSGDKKRRNVTMV